MYTSKSKTISQNKTSINIQTATVCNYGLGPTITYWVSLDPDNDPGLSFISLLPLDSHKGHYKNIKLFLKCFTVRSVPVLALISRGIWNKTMCFWMEYNASVHLEFQCWHFSHFGLLLALTQRCVIISPITPRLFSICLSFLSLSRSPSRRNNSSQHNMNCAPFPVKCPYMDVSPDVPVVAAPLLDYFRCNAKSTVTLTKHIWAFHSPA